MNHYHCFNKQLKYNGKILFKNVNCVKSITDRLELKRKKWKIKIKYILCLEQISIILIVGNFD